MTAFLSGAALADETDHGELAKQLANPVSSLITVPLRTIPAAAAGPSSRRATR
jgi:hypothetical protein